MFSLHQSSNTPHLALYRERVDGALAPCMVSTTLGGKPTAVKLSLSRARSKEPCAPDEDERFPRSLETAGLCVTGVAKAGLRAAVLSPPASVSLASEGDHDHG